MATKKQTPPTTTAPKDAVATYTGGSAAGDPTAGLNLGPIPSAVPASSAPVRGNPIGVPPYATDPVTGNIATRKVPFIDPSTGVQAIGANGQPLFTDEPVPWTAQVQRMVGGSGFQGIQTQQVMPRYYEGSDVEILGRLSLVPEELWTLQQEMLDARVYGSQHPNIQFGILDRETVAAFRDVLTTANATGLDYETVIQNYQKVAKLAPKPPPTPHVNTVTNPTDLIAVFKTAARSAIGHELTTKEAQRYVSAFQSQESQYGDARQAMLDAGGGTLTAPPDPSNYITAQLQQDRPGEVQQNNLLGAVDTFRSMLSGPSPRTPGTG